MDGELSLYLAFPVLLVRSFMGSLSFTCSIYIILPSFRTCSSNAYIPLELLQMSSIKKYSLHLKLRILLSFLKCVNLRVPFPFLDIISVQK